VLEPLVLVTSVFLLGNGSGSENRTMAGADRRLRFVPTELDFLRLDFIEERMGLLTRPTLLGGEDTSFRLARDDVLERRCEVGVVVPLEWGDEVPNEEVDEFIVAAGELEELGSTMI
jgi:hypothetical protein